MFDLPSLLIAARDTVQQPRQGARTLLNMQLPAITAWMALLLMAVVSSALTALTFLMSGFDGENPLDPTMVAMFSNPIQLALVQVVALAFGVWLIHVIGRLFSGTGQFHEALILVAWLEFILLLLQIAQMVLLLVSPQLAAALGMFGLVLFLWLLSNFVAELHGYASVLTVFFGILGSVLAVSFAAALLIVVVVGLGG